MKTLLRISLVLALVFVASRSWSATDTLTILHINDTHSCLSPYGPRGSTLTGTRGGIARAATVVGMTRQSDPHVIFVHGGDFMIGDLFFNTTFGVAELRMLSALGLDALALGNHEFDLGPDVLSTVLDSLSGSGIAVLSSNLIVPNELARLSESVKTSTIRTYGSTKVGFLALTTPETNLLSRPGPAVLDTNVAIIAATKAAELRESGAQVVILLSHLGFANDRQLATNIPGIDVIISAHSHEAIPATPVVNPTGDTTWIEQAGSFYSHVGMLQIIVENGKARMLHAGLIPLDASIPEEPQMKAIVDGLIADIENVYGPVYTDQIAEASADLDEAPTSLMTNGPHDTPVGNLVADAERAAFRTDIAIVPGGSTAQPLWHGPLVADDIYKSISYGFNTDNGLDYHLATFEVTGEALAMGLEFGLAAIELDDEFLSQVSGMAYTYDPTKPSYERLTGVTIAGAALDPARSYTVTANEFVVAVMGALSIPIANVHVYGQDTTEFQTVTAYVGSWGTISPRIEGRVKAEPRLSVKPSAPSMGLLLSPNPANAAVTLTYDLPIAERASAHIFDLKGTEVATRRFVSTGRGTATLNIADLPAGRYILRLDCAERSQATVLLVQ